MSYIAYLNYIVIKWVTAGYFIIINNLCHSFGNLFHQRDDHNLFTNDCPFVWYQHYSIPWLGMAVLTC